MMDSAGGIGEFDTELYKLLVRLQGTLNSESNYTKVPLQIFITILALEALFYLTSILAQKKICRGTLV